MINHLTSSVSFNRTNGEVPCNRPKPDLDSTVLRPKSDLVSSIIRPKSTEIPDKAPDIGKALNKVHCRFGSRNEKLMCMLSNTGPHYNVNQMIIRKQM